MSLIVVIAVFAPVFVALMVLLGMRVRAARTRRIEQYRKSPDSRIIALTTDLPAKPWGAKASRAAASA